MAPSHRDALLLVSAGFGALCFEDFFAASWPPQPSGQKSLGHDMAVQRILALRARTGIRHVRHRASIFCCCNHVPANQAPWSAKRSLVGKVDGSSLSPRMPNRGMPLSGLLPGGAYLNCWDSWKFIHQSLRARRLRSAQKRYYSRAAGYMYIHTVHTRTSPHLSVGGLRYRLRFAG